MGNQLLEDICKLFNDGEKKVQLTALRNISSMAEFECVTSDTTLNKLVPLFIKIAESSDTEAKSITTVTFRGSGPFCLEFSSTES